MKEKVRREQQIANQLETIFDHENRINKYPKFRLAQKFWSENHIPAKVLCRDQQKKQIQSFIRESLQQKGSRESLYISGVPGIGKTICVTQVVNKIQEQNEGINQFQYIYLNSLKLNKQADIYKALYNELINNKQKKRNRMDSKNAMYSLNDLFQKGKIQQQYEYVIDTIKLIVIDEIDYLDTKDHDVLYHLFDWTQNMNVSKMIIIAISNTIGFPQQLSTKILSRIGQKRLVFRPYSDKAMAKIIEQRIQQLDQPIIQERGLEFIAKKVTSSSSDVRKILQILREAVYMHVTVNQSKGKSYLEKSRISVATIEKAYKKVFQDVLTQQFMLMPDCYKTMLIILAQHYRRQYHLLSLAYLYELAKNKNLSQRDTYQILLALKQMGVIKILQKKISNSNREKSSLNHMDEDLIELRVKTEAILAGRQI